MSLDYEFAAIDVDITTHPKAFAAGVEAMGLWLFGMTHARLHKTGGRVERAVVLGAWGGRRNILLAKRLVEAGLWVANEDGSWSIWNFAKKSPGDRRSSAERVKRFREQKKRGDVTLGNALHGVTETPDVTLGNALLKRDPVTSASYSSSLSSDSFEPDPDLPPLSPPARDEVSQGPPEWFASVVSTVEMASGEILGPVPMLWLRYDGHRASKTEREGRAWPTSAKDAQSWLVGVVVPEVAKARREARSRERGGGTAPSHDRPELTAEEHRRFASEMAARMVSASKPKRGAA